TVLSPEDIAALAVPEPSSILLGLGGAALVLRRRRGNRC
ncbi:MAG: PEP-CTERM sorting domain-containing protein, partial [Verrucomicrobiaceae bacterium]